MGWLASTATAGSAIGIDATTDATRASQRAD